MPPISKEYAIRKIEGKSVDGIDKFQKGWQWKDPFFYIEICLLLLGIGFITLGIREKRKKKYGKEITGGTRGVTH